MSVLIFMRLLGSQAPVDTNTLLNCDIRHVQ